MRNISFKQFLINEMPIPGNWDQAAIADGNSFKFQLQYALERAKRIGGGSSRVAFMIPYKGRNTVLKIAKNKKGLYQNEFEAEVLTDGMVTNYDITIPIIDYDEKSKLPRWIHTEFAGKAKKSDFIKQIDATIEDLIGYATNSISRKRFAYEQFTTKEKIDKMDPNNPIIYHFVDLMADFNFNPSEFSRVSNWGIYKNKLVIIDVGANNDILSTHYNN